MEGWFISALAKEQFIELAVGSEICALSIKEINEIIQMQNITKLPFSRAAIKGVIHLRGKIVPVLSLRNILGLPDEPYTKLTRMIILSGRGECAGLIVDKVHRLTTYEKFYPLSALSCDSIGNGVFSGAAGCEERLIGILKVDRLV